RTWVSQNIPALSAYTEDDGDTWHPSTGYGLVSGFDHETIGAGPFAGPLGPVGGYPNAVYYASHDDVVAQCALSLDGGQTYGVALPMWDTTQCETIHGHLKVSPVDGTVYVPVRSCDGGAHAGLAVSTDGGLSWTVKRVGTNSGGNWDPAVGIGAGGAVYFGYG